ncbi:ankyrin [Melanomma pulvis-pyrius CBS 109.77]|uniref:Ankyrin n=1 Tax=Melanomma pulvis-pyrius CBS 109.77 TaxID=1314802 RepID=A0A6A6WT07_9PLEO|nr:ankyrin [Melanomma pulvis-pyrius CBS 109.77]
MADPLSIVATVVGISDSITRQIQDYRKWSTGAKDGSKTGMELLSELHNMQLVLEQLRQLESQTGFIANQGDHSKARILSSLSGCQQIIQELEQKQNAGGRKLSRLKSLTYSIRQRDIERLVQSLHVYQKELQLLMTIQLFQATSRMNSQLRGQTTPIDIPNSGFLSPMDSDERHFLVLDWLTSFDYQSRHHELSRVRAPHTGAWFLESNAFKSWLGHPSPGSKIRPSNVLWCHGVPGSGKSVLMATAINHVLTEVSRDPTIGLAYFYFDYKTKASSRDIISCLLKQLCAHQRQIPRSLQQLYDRYREDEVSGSWETLKAKKGPETGELFAALLDIASEFKRTLLCIDGLDECAPEYQDSLLEVIRRIMKSKCRLLVSSRDQRIYQDLFQGKPNLHVEAASDDVKAYVGLVLSNHPELRDMVDQQLEIRIAKCLSEKADGLFLFVYLSMQGLLEQTSVSELKNALEEMPANLDDVYNDILQRIRDQSSSKSRLAMRIFMWLSYCEQPLTVAELQHAIAVDPIRDADDIDPDRIPPARFFEDDRHLVLLAHASLSQYLSNLKQSLFPLGPKDLAYSLLTYLHYAEFATGPCKDSATLKLRLKRYPLAYWQGRVPKGIMEFLSNPLKRAAFVQIMYVSNTQAPESYREFPAEVSGLHLMILQDDDGPSCAQMTDSWGRTPLHSAKLLAHGSPVDALDKDGRTAVHLAAKSGNVPIVLKLLSKGADPARLDKLGKSAFDYAAAENHPHVISELLHHSPDGIFSEGNALLAAATAGHSGIVEALLMAAKLGFEEIVKILLERGTYLNSRDSDSMTALHYASAAGRTSMVKLLLANGSNVTARDREGRTALFLAAEREYGAEIEARNDEGKTALFECAEKGNVAGVDFLLRRGATVSSSSSTESTASGEVQENALQIAAYNGHEAVVRVLLEKYPDFQGTTMRTTLSYAAAGGQVGVALLLLDAGVDVDVQDEGYESRTALTYAVEAGKLDMAKFLLDQGARVNSRSASQRTPLFWAIWGGHVEAIRVLLDYGADVNSLDDSHLSPLLYAVQHGHALAVKCLLERGADQSIADAEGRNASYYALKNQDDTMQAILQAATSLQRSSTFTTHRDSDPSLAKPAAVARTSAAKEFLRSQSDAGPRSRSSKLFDSSTKVKEPTSSHGLSVETSNTSGPS